MPDAFYAAHDRSQKAANARPSTHSLAELKQLHSSLRAGLQFLPGMLPVNHRPRASFDNRVPSVMTVSRITGKGAHIMESKIDLEDELLGEPWKPASGTLRPSDDDTSARTWLAGALGPTDSDDTSAIHEVSSSAGGQEDGWQPDHQGPFRDPGLAGYKAPPEKVTWAPFKYASPSTREAAVRKRMHDLDSLPPMPEMNVVLIGGVASGKGTLATMLRQAFRTQPIGIGEILRAEAHTERGKAAQEVMARGELLPDEFVLALLEECVQGKIDCDDLVGSTLWGNAPDPKFAAEHDASSEWARNGWLFDGFPRTPAQAEALLSKRFNDLRPDAVILVERPDELVKEFALGRCFDPVTGQAYHPVYAPPPKEVVERLVWRLDDTEGTVERRIKEQKKTTRHILDVFLASGVPLLVVDNARSELESFGDIFEFLSETGMRKMWPMLAHGKVPSAAEKPGVQWYN